MDNGHLDDEFVNKYSRLVYIAIEKRLRECGVTLPREEVLDLQQDVFTSILEGGKLDTIRKPDSMPYWIAIVSANAAMQYLRKRRRIEPERTLSLFDKIGETEVMELVSSSGLSASEEMDRDALSGRIDAAIESLPVKEKLVIKLSILHDKKYEEIADILSLPKGTVSNYIKRAKEKLKEHLKEFK